MSADVYAVAPHTGRGGWTWYTGSAGLMYRFVLESLLGVNLEVGKLRLTPCLPNDWKGFSLRYRYRETFYKIEIRRATGDNQAMRVTVDGIAQADALITLVDDRQEHVVEIQIYRLAR